MLAAPVARQPEPPREPALLRRGPVLGAVGFEGLGAREPGVALFAGVAVDVGEVEEHDDDDEQQHQARDGVDVVGGLVHGADAVLGNDPEVGGLLEGDDGAGPDDGVVGVGVGDHGVEGARADLAHLGDLVPRGVQVKVDGLADAPPGLERALQIGGDGIAGVADPAENTVRRDRTTACLHKGRTSASGCS